MSESSFKIPRHWWGKIIGGVIGLFRGGITGAIVGALLGHFVDRFLAGITGVSETRTAFFEALFSTLGHLAKADGRVTETEIRMVESLMQRMQITGEERQKAIHLFKAGKEPGFKLETTLRPFLQHSVVRHDLRQMFMEILVEAAYAGGTLSQQEQSILVQVAGLLRIPPQLLSAMLHARGPAAGQRPGGGPGRGVPVAATLEQAYAHLGLQSSATDAEV